MAESQDFQNIAPSTMTNKPESSGILSQIKALEKGDAAGTVGTVFAAAPRISATTTSVAGLTGMTAITFPAGLGDDPAQPYFMTYVPMKITSAVGGTMGDMSFAAATITKDNIAQVALPIPTGINVAYAQAWDQTDVNAVQGSSNE